MKLLFVMSRPSYARLFEAPLELLAERGHRVHVGVEGQHKRLLDQWEVLERLSSRHAGITYGLVGGREPGPWTDLAESIRASFDYLFHLGPQWDESPTQRERFGARVPALRLVLRLAGMRSPRARRVLAQLLRGIERSLPPNPGVAATIERHRPDALAVTPLAAHGTPQGDWISGARAFGVGSAGCIASWDNLTSKGQIREMPDLVAVWNEWQRREAVELHGVPRERLTVTGAQNWDQWFAWGPSSTRHEFCDKVGLRPDRPFVLFLGSSGLVGSEREAVTELVRRMRSSGGAIAEVGVLVRPHPYRPRETQWDELMELGLAEVAVWPRQGKDPSGPDSKAEYYDSLYHAATVSGINTSAFIEGAIVGRTSHTLLLPEFAFVQEGLVHFSYLAWERGGPLRVARSWDEHLGQLQESVIGPEEHAEHLRRFVASFARPHGTPGTPLLVAALEDLAAAVAPSPAPAPAWAPVVRLAVAPVAHLRHTLKPGRLRRRARLAGKHLRRRASRVAKGRWASRLRRARAALRRSSASSGSRGAR